MKYLLLCEIWAYLKMENKILQCSNEITNIEYLQDFFFITHIICKLTTCFCQKNKKISHYHFCTKISKLTWVMLKYLGHMSGS
jgi:hypothetical protein